MINTSSCTQRKFSACLKALILLIFLEQFLFLSQYECMRSICLSSLLNLPQNSMSILSLPPQYERIISSFLLNCILPKKELPTLRNGYYQTTSKPICRTVPCKHTTSSQSSCCLDIFIANLIRNRSHHWVQSPRRLTWPFLKVNNCNQYCDILLYHFLIHATGQILTQHWKIILVWFSGK